MHLPLQYKVRGRIQTVSDVLININIINNFDLGRFELLMKTSMVSGRAYFKKWTRTGHRLIPDVPQTGVGVSI
jgi:hypothetical protein